MVLWDATRVLEKLKLPATPKEREGERRVSSGILSHRF